MNRLKTKNNRTSYDVESEVESFHWWFVVRRKLLKSILSSVKIQKNSTTIDIGCGAGSNLSALASAGVHPIGLDQSIYALTLVKEKGDYPRLAGDLNNLPIKTKSVGLIIATDILEHLNDDTRGINESYRVLEENGLLILTVPAFKFLWGLQDKVTGHKRRYTRKKIVTRLREAGFDILRSSYFNFFLFFPILFARRAIRLLNLKIESENEVNSPVFNLLFRVIFSLEVFVLKHFSFPFGVSILCIARKKQTT